MNTTTVHSAALFSVRIALGIVFLLGATSVLLNGVGSASDYVASTVFNNSTFIMPFLLPLAVLMTFLAFVIGGGLLLNVSTRLLLVSAVLFITVTNIGFVYAQQLSVVTFGLLLIVIAILGLFSMPPIHAPKKLSKPVELPVVSMTSTRKKARKTTKKKSARKRA